MPVVRDLQALTGSRRFGTAGGIGSCVPIDDRPRNESADEITESVGDEVDHALRSSTNLLAGALIGVDLSADEEEVVADAVENDSEVQQSHHRAHRAHSEGEISKRPCRHAHEHDHLDAESAQS